MIAVLTRGPSTDEGTFGALAFGEQVVNTVELPWRDNMRQISCIPPGTYECAIVQSPRFGRVYEVKNVPGRSHVLIHPANFAGDALLGWTTELQGCIAPGERRGRIKNPSGKMQRAVLVSRPAVTKLMSWAAGVPFTLEVRE